MVKKTFLVSKTPAITILLMLLACSISTMTLQAAENPTAPRTPSSFIQLDNNRITIDYNGNFSPAEKAKLAQWLQSVTSAMTYTYGRLPLDTIYIELIPYRKTNEPVPFGKIVRWPQQGITFHVNPGKNLDDFINDWTAYHEFSHLMIPYPGDDDMWFSEGLASYYQNIIMGRAGILSPLQAWQKIYDGFVRGSKDTRMQHLTLKQLSPSMWENRSFMRVYWSGAYYFLSVDIALRQQHQSLDQVLSKLQRCCLQSKQSWTALSLINKMDQLSNTRIFSEHYQSIINSNQLSGFESNFDTLGLTLTNEKLAITAKRDSIAPKQNNKLYQQIMSRPTD